MGKTKYQLKKTVADEEWDRLVDNSINGTIFSKSYYLNATNEKYDLFYCYNNNELRAAVTIVEAKKRRNHFIIYHGIMYNTPSNKQNLAQQLSEQFNIQTFIAEELSKKYTSLDINLHASIIDIRAFLWVNFHEELKPKYDAHVRYTSYVDISDFSQSNELEDIQLYNNASSSRRQQIRYSLKKGYQTVSTTNANQFIDFYKKTMQRQNIETADFILDDMSKVIHVLLQNNVAKIYATYDELGDLCCMILMGWDTKRAYYIFGANDPDKRNGHGGTAVLWSAFSDLNKMGINEVDLEGVNSPQRGWFKLSFGGTLIPYYRITLQHES